MKDQKYLKFKRETFILLGFYSEVIMFVLTGWLIANSETIAIFTLLLSFLIAFIVGDLIGKNAVENFKRGLK